MSLRRRWAIAVILLVVCAFPRQGLAQGWEFIFEMSGPGTFVPGSFAYCKVDLGAGDVYECSAAVVRFQERRDLDYWLRLGGDFALSVRNKPEDRQVYTANFDPAFEFRSVNTLATRRPGDPPDKVSFLGLSGIAPGFPEAPYLGRMESMGRPRKYSPEVRDRAVRLVFERRRPARRAQWAAHPDPWPRRSAARRRRCGIGCAKRERDQGRRPGLTTDERAVLKEQAREIRELRRE